MKHAWSGNRRPAAWQADISANSRFYTSCVQPGSAVLSRQLEKNFCNFFPTFYILYLHLACPEEPFPHFQHSWNSSCMCCRPSSSRSFKLGLQDTLGCPGRVWYHMPSWCDLFQALIITIASESLALIRYRSCSVGWYLVLSEQSDWVVGISHPPPRDFTNACPHHQTAERAYGYIDPTSLHGHDQFRLPTGVSRFGANMLRCRLSTSES